MLAGVALYLQHVDLPVTTFSAYVKADLEDLVFAQSVNLLRDVGDRTMQN